MAKCFKGNPVYRQFVGARNDRLAQRECSATSDGTRSVYYTGPCPDADPNDQTNMDSCACSGICGGICSGPCGGCACMDGEKVFAFYAACGRTCLAAGEAFHFDSDAYSIGPVEKTYGNITLGLSGRYLAVWTLTGRAQTNIDSVISLRLNGAALPCAMGEVYAMQGETVQITRQAIFTAQQGSTLQLVTSGALGICAEPAATLTIVRIG